MTKTGLVDRLVARLTGRTDGYEPYVVENRVRQTKTLHVTVIWAEWAGLSSDQRSAVILDAYEKAGTFDVDKITVAMGLTPGDAASLGLLPFSVVPVARKLDAVKPSELAAALRRLPFGFRFESGGLIQVKFHLQEEAEDAYRRLALQFEGKPYWALTQEVASVG